ncbi:MAG: non-heme iron oxygenase ferredoxin subunit [Betaproteobacteria bacterium]
MSEATAWHAVAAMGEVAEGEAKQVCVGAEIIAIYNLEGTFYATSDTCTHEEASLCDGYIEGDTIECPLHQAVFHIPTGKVLREPAKTSLRTFPVRVVSATIEIEV